MHIENFHMKHIEGAHNSFVFRFVPLNAKSAVDAG